MLEDKTSFPMVFLSGNADVAATEAIGVSQAGCETASLQLA